MFIRDDFRRAVLAAMHDSSTTTSERPMADLEDLEVEFDDTTKLAVTVANKDEWALVQEEGFPAFQLSATALIQLGIAVGIHLERLRREGLA